jgi:hypothetical protein
LQPAADFQSALVRSNRMSQHYIGAFALRRIVFHPTLLYNPAMSYEGEILNACPSDIDFTNTWAVVVSGASWNPCGHMLFCCGTNSSDSWYLHVAGQGVRELLGFYAYPKFMRGDT